MKKFILFLFVSLHFAGFSFGQIDPATVKVNIKELSPGLHLIKIYGCNCLASIGEDGIILVDASYEELGEKLKSEIKKIDERKINYLINTHWHFDHVGGNYVIGKEAVVITNDLTRALLTKDEILLGENIKAHPAEILPKITFSSEMNLFFNSDTVKLISMPGGHTGGDILVYFKKANVLHIGDIAFSDMFPFCDVTHGGSVSGISENIGKIISMFPGEVRIITGHGREYNIEDLKNYKKMVDATYRIVTDEIKKNRSLEEIKKNNVLKDWTDWGVAFTCDDWIEMIYNSEIK